MSTVCLARRLRLIDNPGEVTLVDINDLHIFKCAECARMLVELRPKKNRHEASE
jgi:hypothetical protein